MTRLLIACAVLVLPSQVYAQFPSQNITLPTLVIPASAVDGGGTLTTTCLTWPLGTPLCEEAVNHLFQRNTTSAERFSIANTYTSATNYEAFSVDWQTVANTAIVGTRTAATGTRRPLRLVSQSTNAADAYATLKIDLVSLPIFRAGYLTSALSNVSDATAGTWFSLGEFTSTATSGTVINTAILPTYNQSSGTAANTDLLINRTQTAIGSGAQLAIDTQIANVPQFSLSNVGKVTVYNTVATAGQGVDVVRAQATTGTVTNSGTASIATWTPGAADVEVEVGCRVNITVSTNHTFSCDVTYTDVANVSRTRVLMMYPITGTALTSGLMTNAIGAGDYASAVTRIGVKASTAITVRTSAGGTFTTVTYTASGTIKQVG